MSKSNWKPSSYDVDNAMKDMFSDSSRVTNVTFTDKGVIREYTNPDGSTKVQLCEDADNEKGHVTADYHYDSDGNYIGYDEHK